MESTDKTSLELSSLESKIDDLIIKITALSDENEQLREQKESLANEKYSLLEKTDQAKKRVEAMIVRLKTLEAR
ncbi:MAG: TIGR02449 family protein [Pseudomonadota bacterium]|nr:TIGR02449 family protein [Pseudomonadota bacterium]|tara:strand:+ start:23 stop:244 length:222 start_codon:yes stop_codon:yes gene_type:complete